jgi:hypothetical protein
MNKKRPYDTLAVSVEQFNLADDVITSSIIDNDGDFREWEEDGETW